MGAFLLHPIDTAINTEGMNAAMARRGFGAPEVHELGQVRLYLWSKQLVNDPVRVSDRERGSELFAAGSLIYRGLGQADSLRALLTDLDAGTVDRTALRGHYGVIHHDARGANLLVDPNGLFAVFFDRQQGIVSSSQLALLSASPRAYSHNRLGLLEKLLTGIVIGPDTIFDGLDIYTPAVHGELTVGGVRFLDPRAGLPSASEIDPCGSSRDACARDLLDHLHMYFRDAAPLAAEQGVDIGLSGGYDSRLIFSLTSEMTGVTPHIHSHWTDDTHLPNIESAKSVAATRGVDVTVIRTEQPVEMAPGQLLDSLDNAAHYYDGRNNNNMGFYSEVYTRQYRQRTIGGQGLGLSGLNGEVFRNYNHVHRPLVDVIYWLYVFYFYPGISNAFASPALLKQVTDRMLEKISAILGMDLPRIATPRQLRRHLGEVRAPFYCGPVINANLTLSHYLAPFAEYSTSLQAYRASRHIWWYGDFVGRMIELDDPKLGAIQSHYGHPVAKPSRKSRVADLKWAVLPYRLMMYRRDNSHKLKPGQESHLQTMLDKSDRFAGYLQQFRELYPEVRFDEVLWYHQAFANAVFTAHVMDSYSDALEG